MDERSFWELIETTRDQTDSGFEQGRLIAAELVKRGLTEIESYARFFSKYMDEAFDKLRRLSRNVHDG